MGKVCYTEQVVSQKIVEKDGINQKIAGKDGISQRIGKDGINQKIVGKDGIKQNFKSGRSQNSDNKMDKTTDRSTCLMQCSEKHYTENCPSFIALNVEERINIIKDKGACWACMRIGHKSSYCWRRRRCTKDNCNMFHHELLHSQEDSKVEIEANHMDERGGGSCLLQLMKIKTECNNDVNVLWDGGATLSLITFKRAAQLGLTGKSVRLSVTKVGGITDKIDSYKDQLYLIDKAGKKYNDLKYNDMMQ